MFLLDTNVVSEARKVPSGRADRHVAAWLVSIPAETTFLSAIVVGELALGVLLADRRDKRKAAILRDWLNNQLIPAFSGRIIPVDTAVARCSAALSVPDPRPARDAYIAATALVHGMTVITRNTADFGSMGVATLNPWTPT